MKRYSYHINNGIREGHHGDYILFTDHEDEIKGLKKEHIELLDIVYMSGIENGKSGKEAAIKKAVEEEREELVNEINAMSWEDCLGRADVEQKILNMIRSRGEKP